MTGRVTRNGEWEFTGDRNLALAQLRAEVERLREGGKHLDGVIRRLSDENERLRERHERLRQAAKTILARHSGYCPMGSWKSPGHDVILAEWATLDMAVASDEEKPSDG